MGKKPYFALYDYGQGGLWTLIAAESAARIRGKYPQLEVYEDVPPMLDEATAARIRAQGVQDIDAPPGGWLADLVAGKGAGGPT